MRISFAMLLLVVVSVFPSIASADEPLQKLRCAELRFVGGEKEEPLADVQLLVTQGYGSQQKTFGPYTLDKNGVATVELPLGFYGLHLSSKKDWRYLAVEKVWAKRERRTRPDLSLNLTSSGVEKWLDGEARPEDYTAPAEPDGVPRLIYRLLPACELTLRAIDAETGAGIAGVTFYTENALAEDWGHSIESENLGAKPPAVNEPDRVKENSTDGEGIFRRLVGANAGYKYGVELIPDGYELVEPRAEVTIDIVYGQARAEQVFRFRRTK